MLVLKGLVDLHRTFSFSFFSITGWGIDLEYGDITQYTYIYVFFLVKLGVAQESLLCSLLDNKHNTPK